MILTAKFLFWILVGLIFHSYVLFPIILALASKFRKAEPVVPPPQDLPKLSILIAAYNEEELIEEKLLGILDSDYPLDKIQILVGSDCSTDKTNIILGKLEAQYPERIGFTAFTIRQGKPKIINQLISKATGEIIILSDANVMFDQNTIIELIKPFAKAEIGLVDSQMINKGARASGISIQEKAYISREVAIKYHESLLWGTMMGPFGGCFAMRKELYQEVPGNYLVDDFFLNMLVLEKGFQAVNNPKALVYEDVSNDIGIEFRRKVRIATGNFQNLKHFKHLLWPFWKGLGFSFLSHKVLRWLGPFFFGLAFILLLMLSAFSRFYLVLTLIYLGILILPLIDLVLKKMRIHISLFRFITHFCAMNWALFVGFIRYGKGVKSSVWEPTKRNQ